MIVEEKVNFKQLFSIFHFPNFELGFKLPNSKFGKWKMGNDCFKFAFSSQAISMFKLTMLSRN